MFWFLMCVNYSAVTAAEDEQRDAGSSGSMLRKLLSEAGFSDVLGAPSPHTQQNPPAPPGAPGPGASPTVSVAHVLVHEDSTVALENAAGAHSPGRMTGEEPGDRVHFIAPAGAPVEGQGAKHGGHVHVVAPEGAPNGPPPTDHTPDSAPGFAFSIATSGQHGIDLTAVVVETNFTLRDDGEGEDLQAQDGVWTAMIERYPPGRPIEVYAGDVMLFSGDIQLVNKLSAVPRMEITVSQ